VAPRGQPTEGRQGEGTAEATPTAPARRSRRVQLCSLAAMTKALPLQEVGVLNSGILYAESGAAAQSAFCRKYAALTPQQCRMARAALLWSRDDLAAASGVSWRTITRFEAGESVLPPRVQAMRTAFEAEGLLFITDGRFAGGVAPSRKQAP
jgi:DNA-binding XRE family transcriptional regulator